MLVTRKRTTKAMTAVGGLLAGTLVMVPGISTAVPAVPAAQAGSIEVWGTDPDSNDPVRTTHLATDGPWTAIAQGRLASFGITSAGTLQRLTGTLPFVAIPANLASEQVTAVSTFGRAAAVVKADGSVQLWGAAGSIPPATLTVAALGGDKAVDVAVDSVASILLEDGRVLVYSNNGLDALKTEDGVEVTTAVEVATQTTATFARLRNGGLVASDYSGDPPVLPATISGDDLDDPVAGFEVGEAGVAVTESGAVHTFNTANEAAIFPADAVDGKVVDVATASSGRFAALTDDDEVVVWGLSPGDSAYEAFTIVPAAVTGRPVADLVGGYSTFAAIVTTATPFSLTTAASASGTPQVGATLTGTPATFTGGPVIANRWLADNQPIAGANGNTVVLTAAQLGKSITFESRATRGTDAPIVSTSVPIGPVVAAPAVASSTTVSAPASAYGRAGTATVTISNAAGRPIGGTVTLSGAGAAQTAAVAGGQATFALDKTLAAGSYTLTAAYSGSASVLNASAGTATYTVAKAKSKAPTFKANKASTSKKKGKATVTVGTGSGLAKASGKATVTLKSGKTTKKIKVTLSGGKKSISLPKLKKGTWKVQVSYNGDKNYVAQKSKSVKLKIKK